MMRKTWEAYGDKYANYPEKDFKGLK